MNIFPRVRIATDLRTIVQAFECRGADDVPAADVVQLHDRIADYLTAAVRGVNREAELDRADYDARHALMAALRVESNS